MIVFKIEFPLKNTTTLEDIFEIEKKWIYGSQNYSLAEKEIKSLNLKENSVLKNNAEKITTIFAENSEYQGHGFIFENMDENKFRWLTQIISAKFNNEVWISITLSHDSTAPINTNTMGEKPKKPYIVRQLIEEIGTGNDDLFHISDKPIILEHTDADLELATKIVQGETSNVLPLVYVSSTDYNEPYIDVGTLSKWLSGMAHVIVEPSREFSFSLKHKVDSKNVYSGSVCIYWSGGTETHLHLGDKISSPQKMFSAINGIIRRASLTFRGQKKCTLTYIKEINSKQQLESLKQKEDAELDEIWNSFEEEIRIKEDKIQELEELNNKLQMESLQFSQDLSCENCVSFDFQNESDLYINERRDLIISYIKNNLQSLQINTREYDILTDLVNTNYNEKSERENILNSIKNIFTKYKKMDPKTKSTIEELGFEFESDNKHYKLSFKNGTKYKISIPNTSSDSRAGKNIVSKIKKKLF